MSDLDIVVIGKERTHRLAVIQLDGRLNMGNSDRLMEVIEDVIRNRTHHIILDLSGLTSLTSAGLRVMLQAYKTLGVGDQKPIPTPGTSEGGGGPAKSPFLKIVSPPPHIAEILRIAGFDRLMDIFNTLDAAIESYP